MKRIKKIIKDYANDFIGNSIYDILKFIFINVVGVSLSSYITQKAALPYASTIVVVIFAIVAAIFTFILILLVYKEQRKYKFRILFMDVNFEYAGDKMIITTKTTVRAKRSNLTSIYNRSTWFPDEKITIRCLTAGMKIQRLPPNDTSNEYVVLFGRTLKKGDEITYKTEVICENKHGHFKDFYSREIITPLDHLVMTVVVPAKYGYNKIERSKILGSAYSDSSKSESFDFLNVYTWDIEEEPELGYEYKLHWIKS